MWEVLVVDARPEQENLTLDRNGICLVQASAPSLGTAEEFFSAGPSKIREVHYPECAELVRRATGASKVGDD